MPKATFCDVASAKRIIIEGVTGAGKSTAAVALAQALTESTGNHFTAIDFDEIGWAPAQQGEWTQRPDDEQLRIATEFVGGEYWVMTRPWRAGREISLERTELIIYLDYPPRITLTRLVKRTFQRALFGQTCCNGNKESIAKAFSSDSILVWWWKTFRQRHVAALEFEAAPPSPANPPTLRLTHPSQFDMVLNLVSR